jgi:hypothetical protein
MDIEKIKINFLKNCPEFIPELANIWYAVLGSIWFPDIEKTAVIEKLSTHTNDKILPLTFVAIYDQKPAGMCSLRKDDGIRSDLRP